MTFVSACATAEQLAPSKVVDLELATEEAFINICSYAYAAGTGEVAVRCAPGEMQQFITEIVDTGQPFDLPALPPAVVTATADSRHIGGRGIMLIRTMVDAVNYRREGEHNILQLVMQRDAD